MPEQRDLLNDPKGTGAIADPHAHQQDSDSARLPITFAVTNPRSFRSGTNRLRAAGGLV